MTRKDIIIIAVLVNAGLLAILFTMAVNSDDDKVSDQLGVVQTAEIKPSEGLLVAKSDNIEKTIAIGPTIGLSQAVENGMTQVQKVEMGLEQYLEQDDDDLPLKQEEMVEIASSKPIVEETVTLASRFVEVTVKRGDSLDKIARANGVTIQAIKEANKLKNDRLNIGQVLKVPALAQDKKKATEKTKPIGKLANVEKNIEKNVEKLANSQEVQHQYHIIKSGDNPWKIAKQFNMKVDELLKLNHLDEEKARNLKIGDKIRVR
jgi:peptidoglycan endopeptidase LytF